MLRVAVLVPAVLLLASCERLVWKADESRYPTKEAQETTLERHRDRCRMQSRVIVGPTADRPGRAATRVETDQTRFRACMEAAGFRLVGATDDTAAAAPAKTAEPAAPTTMAAPEKPAERPERTEPPAAPAPAPSAATPAPAATPEPEVAAPRTPPPTEKSPPASLAATTGAKAAGGLYRIQLASFRTRSAAERQWARLQAAWPEILGTRDLIVVEKQLAGRGAFYRVQTGGFDTLQAARSTCAALRARNQACFALRRP